MAALMDTVAFSGPGRQLLAVARATQPLGVEIRFLLFHRSRRGASPFARAVEASGHTFHIVTDSTAFDPRILPASRKVLERWQPDVVQTHSYRPTAIAWLLRRQGASWPWVAFYHGATAENLKVRAYHWLDRRLLPSADRIVVMSREQLRHIRHRGKGRQVLNAILGEERQAVGLEPARQLPALPGPRIGVIGRLSTEKGVDIFLEALRGLHDVGLSASAFIVGDGPSRAGLEAQCRALGLHDAVAFLGHRADVGEVYVAVDLIVIPSRSEGLPNVLLEAIAADRYVVATSVGAIPEIMTDSALGLVVPKEDPTALTAAMREALLQPGRRPDPAARHQMLARLSVNRRAEIHVDLYRELVAPEAAG